MTDDTLDNLIKRRETLDKRIRQLQNKKRKKARTDDTRRKILAGAWVLDEAEKRPDFKKFVYQRLDSFLTRKTDREIFGLPVKEEGKTDTSPLPAPVAREGGVSLDAGA